jgi:hypothetical protein
LVFGSGGVIARAGRNRASAPERLSDPAIRGGRAVSELQAALLGGFIGGAVGVASTLVAAYFGPRWLEQWRANIKEEHDYGPRKELLRKMLDKPNPRIRSLQRLRLVTGTTDEECRRLLIEVRARGVTMRGGQEGWALIERYGFDQPQVNEDADDV